MRSQLRSYLRSLRHRGRVESEMESEMRLHLELRAADLERTGLTQAEALRQARIEFGGIEKHKEDMRASLGLRLFDELRADLRYAGRMLRRSPGFTAVAIGSLALGIGANTIIFTLAKGVLLNRLKVPHPEQLRLLTYLQQRDENTPIHAHWGGQMQLEGGRRVWSSFSYPVYQQMLEQHRANPNAVLQDLFAFKDLEAHGSPTITVDGHADVVSAEMVSGNYYQQMEVQPELGRGIQPADDIEGASPVAVISDELWTRFFARSPSAVGKIIHLNLVSVTIVGINPSGFTGAGKTQHSSDVFFPLSLQPTIAPMQGTQPDLRTDKVMWWVEVMGRARPGASVEAGREALDVSFAQAIRATEPVTKNETLPELHLADGSHGLGEAGKTFRQPIYILSGLAGFVLLLACANLANLLLARSAARQREISVRLALGASRMRVLRQVLTESLLLSSLGGAAGFALGYVGRNVVPRLLSDSWEQPILQTGFEPGILAFTISISLLTGVLFGLAPAWQATRTDVSGNLKDTAASTTRRRKGLAGKTIIVFQLALSMVLLVGAGLFARTLINLNATNPGFHPKNLVLFAIQAPKSRYPAPQNVALFERLEQRLTRIPGVQGVTATGNPVLAHSMAATDGFQRTDQVKSVNGDGHLVYYNDVGRGFFDTYRIPVLYGRGFDLSDTSTSPPVAVINETLARRYFPGINPLGKIFKLSAAKPEYQVIGVSADAMFDQLREAAPATVYLLYRQAKEESMLTYVVQSPLPAAAILPAIRSAVAEIDKDLPVRDVRTQQQQIDATISRERLFAMLTAAFGALALVLACIGIYGIMAYDVVRRTSEIGIRMALGAKAGQMLRMVLREASWMAAIGIGAGVGAALLLARFVNAMLFGLQGNDPTVLIGAAGLLFLVAVLSGWRPARRASRIEPMEALRHE
jgi:predicted permease